MRMQELTAAGAPYDFGFHLVHNRLPQMSEGRVFGAPFGIAPLIAFMCRRFARGGVLAYGPQAATL
jgi:hypothetical protein